MSRDPLLELLRPVRRRLTGFRTLRLAMIGLLMGSAAGALVLLASRVWPLLNTNSIVAVLTLGGMVFGCGAGLWKKASYKDAAREMDRNHTEDAMMTALDGLEKYTGNEETPVIVTLQRQDATEAAERYRARLDQFLPWPSWPSWRPYLYGLISVWLVIAAMLLIHNPQDERAEALANAKSAVEELEQKAEKLEEELDGLPLPNEQKEELLKPLDELRKELEASGVDLAEVLQQLAEAMKELERAADEAKAAVERLEAAARALSEQSSLRPLSAAMQDRDAAAMKDAIDELRSRLKELTPAEREALASALVRLAEQQPQDNGAASELAAALEKAAQQARAADEGAAAGEAAPETGSDGDGLAALEEALARELSQGELEQLARSMSGQLGASGQQLASQLADAGGAVPPSWAGAVAGGEAGAGGSAPSGGSGAAGQSGSAGGSSSGSAGGSGAEGGEGSGAGAGAGQGQGSGAGTGSGSGSGNGTGSGSGGGSGTGTGRGNGAGTGTGDRTLVTTPRDLAGPGQTFEDGGPSTGGETQAGGQSPIIDGTTRPYEEVYSEYAAEAKESIGRSQLPSSMQDKVKRYFDNIQPNR